MEHTYYELTYPAMYSLLRQIKQFNYILLGESTHGTEEYFLIRLAITILLVKDFGYTTILFETEWSIGYYFNLFIHSKIDSPVEQVVKRFDKYYPKWMLHNEYIIQLLLFLRKWNKDHTKKVFFYGIDCQNIKLANENVCSEKTLNCSVVSKLIKNYSIMRSSNNYWNVRDSFWETIIQEIQKYNHTSKFVLWAHNSHIGNVNAQSDNQNKINIGLLLDRTYSCFKMGFSTYSGSVKASSEWGKPGRKYRLSKARPDSYEFMFHELAQASNMNAFIYLCNPRIDMNLSFRYVGVVYDSKNEYQAHYQVTNIHKEYNAIVFIDETSYLKGPTTTRKFMKSLSQYNTYSRQLLNSQ